MQTAEAILEIPCKNYPKTYIGETGRSFKTRMSEHRIEKKKLVLNPTPGHKENLP